MIKRRFKRKSSIPWDLKQKKFCAIFVFSAQNEMEILIVTFMAQYNMAWVI